MDSNQKINNVFHHVNKIQKEKIIYIMKQLMMIFIVQQKQLVVKIQMDLQNNINFNVYKIVKISQYKKNLYLIKINSVFQVAYLKIKNQRIQFGINMKMIMFVQVKKSAIPPLILNLIRIKMENVLNNAVILMFGIYLMKKMYAHNLHFVKI